MADFARDLGLERVAVLAVDNEYGAGLARAFAERLGVSGGSVVASLSFPEGDQKAIADAVAALPGLAPRGIYIPAYVSDLASALRLLRETRLRPIVLGRPRGAERSAPRDRRGISFPLSDFAA
jgi:ABC-type branched-subunit amino acid transport system substrate-binding protein